MDTRGFKPLGKSVVEEVPYGMYVWRLPDGEVLGDEDGNFMNVFCIKGDRRAIDALTQAARGYGFPEGTPEWWAGKRRINDEELQEQEMRMKLGLEPDPDNVAALRDEERAARAHG